MPSRSPQIEYSIGHAFTSAIWILATAQRRLKNLNNPYIHYRIRSFRVNYDEHVVSKRNQCHCITWTWCDCVLLPLRDLLLPRGLLDSPSVGWEGTVFRLRLREHLWVLRHWSRNIGEWIPNPKMTLTKRSRDQYRHVWFGAGGSYWQAVATWTMASLFKKFQAWDNTVTVNSHGIPV